MNNCILFNTLVYNYSCFIFLSKVFIIFMDLELFEVKVEVKDYCYLSKDVINILISHFILRQILMFGKDTEEKIKMKEKEEQHILDYYVIVTNGVMDNFLNKVGIVDVDSIQLNNF